MSQRKMWYRGVPWLGVLAIGVFAFGFHSHGAPPDQGQASPTLQVFNPNVVSPSLEVADADVELPSFVSVLDTLRAEQHQDKETVHPAMKQLVEEAARAKTAFIHTLKVQGLTPRGIPSLVVAGDDDTTRGDVLITCSANKDIVAGSVACAAGPITTANEFARCFDGATFPADMEVNSLDFGIEIAEAGVSPNIVTATLYSTVGGCGGVLLDADLTPLAGCTGSIDLGTDGSANGTIQTISFTGCKVPAGTDVVAEISYGPDTRIWPGSNPNGQSCLSYIAADACGLFDLTDLALIGFPNMHLVLNLNAHAQGPPGQCGDGVCEGSEDCCSCREDCGDCVCGDGNCDEPCEDKVNCPEDCAPPPCEKTVRVEIFTDLYPGETTWELRNKDTGEVVASDGPLSDPETLHKWDICIDNESCYNFTIFDAFGDGICCVYGIGSYSVFHDGELVCSGGEFGESETCSDIGWNCEGGECGDGNVDPGEECDGMDDDACPGECQADCTCPGDPGDEQLVTCSADKEVIEGSVACAAGGITVANEFARCFDGTRFPEDVSVNSFDFGVEIAEVGGGAANIVTATLYSTVGGCGGILLDADLTPLDGCTGSIDLGTDGSANFTIQTISFTGCKVPAGTDVVAEISYGPDTRIWPGSNPFGQDCLSYIAADACGLFDLTDLTLIGFPNMHLIINLNVKKQDGGEDKIIRIEILTDLYPGETSWELVHKATGEVVASAGPLEEPATLHKWDIPVALEDNCYNFTIFDEFGDGICCDYGKGSYAVFHEGVLACSGGEFGASETCEVGDECDGGGECGDGNVDPGEDCDPPGSECPDGTCQPDCTCPGDEIPTVSEWGMLVMAVLVLSAGAVIVRRRLATHIQA